MKKARKKQKEILEVGKRGDMEKRHKKSLEEIAQNPSVVGINCEVSFSETEVPVFNSYEKVGEIDVFILDCINGVNYYIEYKCNDSASIRRKAKKQILTAKEFADERHKGNLQKFLYVFGKFNTKELIKGEWVDFSETPYK